ncbi:MAG: PASTA domain-containing protein [Actinobacteria bacterium]|nr:PASTA domain-containing protein [Actinomycetota bacterium]
MRTRHFVVGFVVLLVAALAVSAASLSSAANSPTFRDCSFVGGLDPDFVQLTGTSVGSGGTLTAKSTKTVKLEASESSDPGDSSGHDTFKVTVAAPGSPARKVSGAATGKVILKLPLVGSATGKTNTVSWAATFDNGNHSCPSSQTPQNITPHPFVIKVTGPACVVPKIVGKKLKKAKKALKKADCKLGKVKGPKEDSAMVIKQNPSVGTRLAPSSKVKVTTQ